MKPLSRRQIAWRAAQDIANAHEALTPGGIVVFDDFRSAHAPGVGAAVWEAVRLHELVPFALTPAKMYATWGDAAWHRGVVEKLLSGRTQLRAERQEVMGHQVIRLSVPQHWMILRGFNSAVVSLGTLRRSKKTRRQASQG